MDGTETKYWTRELHNKGPLAREEGEEYGSEEEPEEVGAELEIVFHKKTVFKAGTSVKGTVKLNVTQEVEGNRLMVEVLAREKIADLVWRKKAIEGKQMKMEFEEKPFYSFQYCLQRFQDNCIEPGKYVYPFSLSLPDWLPTSMYQEFDDGCYWALQYDLRARISKRIVSRARFDVLGLPIPLGNHMIKPDPQILKVKNNAKVDKGNISVAVKYPQYVGRGSHIQMSVSCRNNSKYYIERIDLKLIEHKKWKLGAE